MKGTLLLAAALLAAAFMAGQSSASAQPAQSGSAEQAIAQLENDWAAAYIHKDVAALEKILDPEYVATFGEGVMDTRTQLVDDVKSGAFVLQATHLDELKVKVYGDTAVVFGLSTDKAIYKGQDISGQSRWTDVFVKRNGVWRAVATHSTPIPKH